MELANIYEAVRGIEGVKVLDSSVGQYTIPSNHSEELVVVHSAKRFTHLSINVEQGAKLCLTEIFTDDAHRLISIEQAKDSITELTIVELCSSHTEISTSLNGAGAESRLNSLFLAADKEKCGVKLTTRHMSPDCRSNSLIKGVASGISEGCFEGLVYVAKDAQRTDARQTSRNIELNDGAKIKTLPQLEIYADDVKCSHGATVGQLDSDAILYMRQRGLSLKQARRLQIEGFAADVVSHSRNEALGAILREAVESKLEKM